MPRPTSKKSIVWTFFELDTNKKNATCKLCRKSFVNHGNTSNLKEHLKRLHPIQLENEETERTGLVRTVPDPEPSTSGTILLANFVTNSESNSQNADTQIPTGIKRKRQLRLCASEIERDLSEEKVSRLDEAVLRMIVQDYQPLSVVDDRGFRNLIKELNPKYNLPSRKKLSEKLLPNFYTAVKANIRARLQELEFISVTSDYWKGNNNKTFISLTAHYIYKNKLVSTNLSTKEVIESHTATNTAAAIMDICNDWQILHKIVTVVTDNAANMKKAVIDDLKKHHHPCVAHTLNLTVCDAINGNQELSLILIKCRNLVTHFKQSAVAAYKLRSKQLELNLPDLKMKQDVPTRWNSAYLMLDRLLTIRQPLTLALTELERAPNNLTGSEWNIIKDCLPILKPALELTELLSGEKYVTMSIIVPLIRGLQYSLQTIMPETSVGTNLKGNLIDIVFRRLGQLECNKFIAKAAFLDPRFKKAGFGTENNAANTQQWVIDELSHVINQNLQIQSASPETTVDSQSVVNPQSSSLLWAYFDSKKAQQERHDTPSITAHVMVKQYVESGLINRDEDPLKYWDEHSRIFPGLHKLAMKYLCIPATSVPSERLFSKAGHILNERRSRLSAEKLDQLIFLGDNID